MLARGARLAKSWLYGQTAPMDVARDILCIGSVLWDVIGRSRAVMRVGSDVPGRITRQPGGVAMNIAMTLRRFGLHPVLLTAIGRDEEGDELIGAADRLGMDVSHVYRSDDLPTDIYMAVEGANGLIAAIADAHSLEAAGDKILRPLSDGRLGASETPYSGLIALDGNSTEDLLAEIAVSPLFAGADLRVAPASPGKAERLLPLLACPRATIYVNLEEAAILCQSGFASAEEAARAMLERGAASVLITDGGRPAAHGRPDGILIADPPQVLVTRVTGAGDTFMAAHIAAEARGEAPEVALGTALKASADYVSGDVPS
jgi:sugar/nucleoside kinase (ribokinase family)